MLCTIIAYYKLHNINWFMFEKNNKNVWSHCLIYLIYLACHLNLDLQYIKTKLIKCEENYFSVVNVLFISVFDHFRKKKAIDLPSVESIISIFTENFVSFSVSIGQFLNNLILFNKIVFCRTNMNSIKIPFLTNTKTMTCLSQF